MSSGLTLRSYRNDDAETLLSVPFIKSLMWRWLDEPLDLSVLFSSREYFLRLSQQLPRESFFFRGG